MFRKTHCLLLVRQRSSSKRPVEHLSRFPVQIFPLVDLYRNDLFVGEIPHHDWLFVHFP